MMRYYPDDVLPTLEQILAQADRISDRPMSSDECDEWFENAVKENRERKYTKIKEQPK